MATMREILAAFSRKEVSMDAVVRAALEHDEWHVPAAFMIQKWSITTVNNAVILANGPTNPRRLVLFTDRLAALRAEGMPFGVMAGKFKGVDVFDALDAKEFDRVDINPGSPTEETFYFEAGSFDLVRLWSRSIRLEQMLATEETPFAQLREHPGFLVAATKEESNWWTVPVPGIEGRLAIAFTAPDRWEIYLRKSGGADAPVKSVTLPGSSMFQGIASAGLQGVVLNPGSRGTVALPLSLFDQITAGQ